MIYKSSFEQINSNLNYICGTLTPFNIFEPDKSKGMAYKIGSTSEIQELLTTYQYQYMVFIFIDTTKGSAGISLPIVVENNHRGCVQIYSQFGSDMSVFTRKYLDGAWYGW